MSDMKLFTVGCSKKSAEEFFDLLRDNGVKRVVDIRRHNTNQLAGFTKQDDLAWFLDVIVGIDYEHVLELAPSEELMHAYRKEGLPFDEFAEKLRKQFDDRKMPTKATFDCAALLCSEADPSTCHRLVAAEYLAEKWSGVEVIHL
ncbi:DUF488 domain-containing protein [Corynebacterium sp. CCUG 71335]|uniref:DUF488 domain-containing protein n=1 Tax=Corynebacterium sp. CCUG 71335 TaxID=2823892 RepID=UPI00210B76F4|nr:DUF488 domain-containing protein [Corynebacterium sp. CCUG 71335]MCQ4620929.1 DUF488 domain-containing protein [Corynebacterium sp. CCUG 71335]